MLTLSKKYLLIIGLFFAWSAAFSQAATVSPDPPSKLNACGGAPNGSITLTITSGTGPFNVFYIGLGFSQTSTIPATQGVPLTITGLQPDNYLLVIFDGDPSANYSTFVNISNVPAVTAVLGSKTDNSSCSVANGQITINASNGTGSFSYAWSSNNGFGPFPNSPNLTGLPGGDYQVIVSDNGSNCAVTISGIHINDPSPVIQTVTTTSPEVICAGSAATISLATTQVLTLPSSYYEIVKNNVPTGVKMSGTGGPLTLTLPNGSFVNGDVLTVRAVDGVCTAVPMSGSVTIALNTPPTSAVLSGTATICSGTSANLKVTITGGTSPYTVTLNNGVPVQNNYVSGTNIPVSPVATTTYSIVSVTDAKGCPAQSISGSAIVTVNSGPTSGVISGTATICKGTPTNLVVTITGGTSPYSFTINNGVGLKTNYVSGTPIPVNPAVTRTYTIVGNVTDANGCTVPGTGSAVVTVNIPPTSATLSLNGASPICAGQNTTLKVAIVGGTGPFSFNITGLGAQVGYVSGTPITVTPATTTTYTLAGLVTDSKGCTVVGTGTTTVTVNPLPTAVVAASPTTICGGGTSTLTFTMTGTPPFDVQYSTGAGTASFSTASFTKTVSVSPASTTTYAITSISDATTCSGLPGSSAVVNVNVPASNAAISGTATVCSATSTNLAVTITGGTSPYTITINNGVGTINNYVSGTPIPVTPAATTTYSLTAVVDANGCPAQALSGTAIVTVNPSPTSATLGGTATICAGTGPTNLSVTIVGGTSPYTVTINNGVGTINNYVSGTAIPVNPATTTTYSIVGNVTDTNGCGVAGTGSAIVTVNTPPSNATISGTATICRGTSTDLIVTITGGTGPFTVTINNGVGTINNYVSGTAIPVAPISNKTYTLTSVTDASTCSAQVLAGSAVVTVKPSPTSATLSGTATICAAAGPTNLKVVVVGGTGPYTVTIDNGVGTINNYVSGTAIPVNPAVTTTYSIVGNVTDATGCGVAGTGTAVVTVSTPPSNATLSGTTTICAGSSANLVVTFTGGTGPYSITIDNGVGTINGYVSGTNIPVTPAASTTYTLTAAADAGGCAAQAITGTAIITLNTAPTSATLSGTTTICGSTTANLAVTVVGGTGPFTVTIDNGVGTINNYVSGASIPVSPASTTTYSIVGNVLDAIGCSVPGSGSAIVTVNTPPTSAVLSGTGNLCLSNSRNIMVTITGGTSPYSITIDNGVGTINNYVSGTSIPVSPAVTTTYNLVGTVADAAGCSVAGSGSAVVTVFTPPSTTFNISTPIACAGDVFNLSATITGGLAPYSLTYTDLTGTNHLINNYVSGTLIPITATTSGVYVLATVTDINSCMAPTTPQPATITVNPLATASLSGNSNICTGGSASLTVTLTGTGPWNIVYTDGSTNIPVSGIVSSPASISVTPLISTTYSLVSVSDAGCGAGTVSGTSSVTVTPIGGNPATFGLDTWLGYIYDDAGDPTPIPAKINFAASKYRGVIDETEIGAMSPFSSYNSVTDEFDLNISSNATGFTVHSVNMCGSYNDFFSARFRMKKTFAQGVYTFTVGGDDGVRLILDGVTIIPGGFSNHAYTTFTSPTQCITAGQHDIVIEYFENSGFSRLTFNYSAAGPPTVTSPVSACVNSAAPSLNASTTDPLVTGFNWYKDAALTTLLFTGANFTPVPADLDMTALGTTSFYVSSVYACGTSAASQVDVNVISSASITLPPAPAQVCQTGGTVDLTTLVSAIPSGGSFSFLGTGVTTSPTFDPTLVTGTTSITVTYTAGSCSTSTSFNIDVVGTASITVPASTISACQSSTPVDLTTLVSATPTGGTFTFTGPGVTGTTFDPSAQLGAVAITVGYTVGGPGGCSDSKTINFNVTTTASLTLTNSNTCPSAAPTDLTTLVSAIPSGGIFTFSGPGVTGNFFNPIAQAGTTATIMVGYDLGGCIASGSLTISVDPTCGGVGCGAFTVAITDTRPSCANPIDGIIAMNISGGTPPYIVSLTDGAGFNKTLPGANPVFSSLSPATYTYTITDKGGAGTSCSLPFSLPVKTSVTASAGSFIDATCFNQATGGATITVLSGGAAPYEYSPDGGANWFVFTSPAAVNNLMPNGTYSILVRDDASDLCPAQVLVTINNANSDILAPYTVTPASCTNNDGTIVIGTVSGGVGPYTFKFDGNNFATLPPANTFTNLSGGTHTFTVIDATSCSKDFPIIITFPGLVNFMTSTVDPDCTGNGTNGSMAVTILSVGSFQLGLSTVLGVPPTILQNSPSDGTTVVTFPNLSKGTYYVYVQSIGAQCPTITATTITGGPEAVDFSLVTSSMSCFGDVGGVTLQGIVGSSTLNYSFEILQLGLTVQSGTITPAQAFGDVPFNGLEKGTYQIRLFQDQSTVNGCVLPITSAFKSFTVDGPTAALDTLYAKRTLSLPDLATGSLLVGVKESGAPPYEVKLVSTLLLDPTKSFALDWTEVTRNPNNLVMEHKISNLYPGQYVLSLKDSLGCQKDYSIIIDMNTDIFIPNVFTPNGDEVNDVFYIRNKPSQTSVVITNRWGKEVYRNSDYDNAWTGASIEDGVYYYSIKAAGQVFNGWLEIQRGQ